MSAQELQELVEKIVQRVMQRIESDAELSRFIKTDEQNAAPNTDAITEARPPQAPKKKLYTESDILTLAKEGYKELVVAKTTIITPAAQDAAKLKGIEIRKE